MIRMVVESQEQQKVTADSQESIVVDRRGTIAQ